jgi:hypothetical protein
MKLKIKLAFIILLFFYRGFSQDSLAVDSVKKILNQRYEDLGKAMAERDLTKILTFKTDDFHSIGPDGRVHDNIIMKEYSKQFITNNIPPYNTKITIVNLRLSYNKIVAQSAISTS